MPPADPALCTVSLYPSVNAVAGALKFKPLPNQVIGSRPIDVGEVTATVVDSTVDYYSADLVRKARYQIVSNRFGFNETIFEVPDTSTCDLSTVLTKVYVR